jgi:hypothetical protein
MIGVKVGDNELTISTNTAIVDTGTSYLLMPSGKNFVRYKSFYFRGL